MKPAGDANQWGRWYDKNYNSKRNSTDKENFNWLKLLGDQGGTSLTFYPSIELLSCKLWGQDVCRIHLAFLLKQIKSTDYSEIFFKGEKTVYTFKFYKGLCTWDETNSIYTGTVDLGTKLLGILSITFITYTESKLKAKTSLQKIDQSIFYHAESFGTIQHSIYLWLLFKYLLVKTAEKTACNQSDNISRI